MAFVHNHNSYSTFVGGVCEVLWKFWFSDGCLSKPRWLVGSVGEWRGWYYLTLMTSFRVGVARDVRPLEHSGWRAHAEWMAFVHNHNSYSTFVGGVCEVLWKFWFSDGCLSKPRWLVGSVGEWRGWYYLMQLKVFHFHYMWACIRLPGVNETTKLMGMGISYSVHRNCKGNLASDKNKRLLLLSLFILPLVRRIWVQLLQIE